MHDVNLLVLAFGIPFVVSRCNNPAFNLLVLAFVVPFVVFIVRILHFVHTLLIDVALLLKMTCEDDERIIIFKGQGYIRAYCT